MHALPTDIASQRIVVDVEDAPGATVARAVDTMKGRLVVIVADDTVEPDAATMIVAEVVCDCKMRPASGKMTAPPAFMIFTTTNDAALEAAALSCIEMEEASAAGEPTSEVDKPETKKEAWTTFTTVVPLVETGGLHANAFVAPVPEVI